MSEHMDRLRAHVRRGSEQAREVVNGPACADLVRELQRAGFGSERKVKRALVAALDGRESREAGA